MFCEMAHVVHTRTVTRFDDAFLLVLPGETC